MGDLHNSKTSKYCLIRFVDDDILYVVPTKSINIIEKNLVWAPYRRMGFYEAITLKFSDDRKHLENVMKCMKRKIQTDGSVIKDCNSEIHEISSSADADKINAAIHQNDDSAKDYIPIGLDITDKVGKNGYHEFMLEHPGENVIKGGQLKPNEFNFSAHVEVINEDIINSDDSITDPNYKPIGDYQVELQSVSDKLENNNNNNYQEFEHQERSVIEGYNLKTNEKSSSADIEEINANLNNSDDSIKDPDYDPRGDSESEDEDEMSPVTENTEIFEVGSAIPENKEIVEKQRVRSIENLSISDSETDGQNIDYKNLTLLKSYSQSKKHFCIFCKKLQTKFARHLILMHKDESLVKEIILLPKKSKIRLSLISDIRTKGDFFYNTSERYNENNLIVVRRPNPLKKRNAAHYKPCGRCGGMYSSISLQNHYRRCEKKRLKGTKDTLVNSKKKCSFVTTACPILRDQILPVLHNDEISQTIISDDVILMFGNRMVQKYRSPHFHKMIRARLRCVARLLLTIKARKPDILNFEQLFDPEYYDCIIKGINEMCELNEAIGSYKAASTAFAVGSYMKKISFYLLSECIKKKQRDKQNDIKDFLHLLDEGLQHDVYKTVEENYKERKRNKIVELPTLSDIIALKTFLNNRRDIYMKKLRKMYSFENWKELLSVLLTSLQLYNRRRAGEMERVKIEDFLRYEQLKDDDEMFSHIPVEEKNRKKNYVRFMIRGKLSRGVPVMVTKENFEGLQMILSLRVNTAISHKNSYLFGLPGNEYNHLSATKLMNRYSKLCGASKPNTLRGTELRKHLATKCGHMDLADVEMKDVANYMGHNEKIHIEHYKMPSVTKDILRISNILELAQGDDVPTDNENETELQSLQNSMEESLMDSSSGQYSSKKRISWSSEEKECVLNHFKYYLENYELPSIDFCHDIISHSDILKRRSATQLKAFIANCIGKEKESLKLNHVTGKRKQWSSAEKNIALRIFQTNIETKRLPSLKFCEKTIKETPELANRTSKMLKAFVHNTIKKQEKSRK